MTNEQKHKLSAITSGTRGRFVNGCETITCLQMFTYSLRFAGRSTVSLAAYRSVYSAESSAGHLLVPGFLCAIAEAMFEALVMNSR